MRVTRREGRRGGIRRLAIGGPQRATREDIDVGCKGALGGPPNHESLVSSDVRSLIRGGPQQDDARGMARLGNHRGTGLLPAVGSPPCLYQVLGGRAGASRREGQRAANGELRAKTLL